MPPLSLATGPYQPTWASIVQHTVPEWMIDAKFGLYAHWGLYAVPGFGNEWYAKHMYDPEHPIHAEHIERFGSPSEFGYKDFISLFMAEHYDPDAWAELIADSGARYAGFSLAHHDGYGLWNSSVYDWHVGNMGPERDLYGELAAALRRRDIRLVAPFHIVRGYNWWLPGWQQYERRVNEAAVAQGKRAAWDLYDPTYRDFYWHRENGGDYDEFLDLWRAKVVEVIDAYRPDLMWFDGGEFRDSPYEPHTLDILSHYLNRSAEWDKEVAVLNKLPVNLKYNFPPEFGVLNYEGGRSRTGAAERPWNDDLKIGSSSWGYLEEQTYLSGAQILHNLIDRVARGGSLMLSISPKPDGTIPDAQQRALREVGDWLRGCGEAIYGTRAWAVHGEGNDDALMAEVHDLPTWNLNSCTAADKRYTRSKDGAAVYAFTLGRPTGRVVFESLGENSGLLPRAIRSVSLLSGAEAHWRREAGGLVIEVADAEMPEAAAVWKVE